MHVRIWDLVCIAVLFTILTLGLWPFHAQKNNVAWLPDRNGLRFGRPGMVYGSNVVNVTSSQDDSGASIELWVQPTKLWDSGTLLTLYSPENSLQFSLCQSLADFELRIENPFQPRSRTARLYLTDVFRRGSPVFITLSSNAQGISIYVDGALARTAQGFQLSAADLADRIIVGDSPRQTRSWKGRFTGLAFYGQSLTSEQVLKHYVSWKNEGRPEVMAWDLGVALYLFDEHTGRVTRSQIGYGSLYIPETYAVLDKLLLKPAWEEFEMSQNYWGAVAKNIVGFVPFGFCYYAYWLVVRPIRKPALVTIVLGAALSFTIEFIQWYLPTRESGMTDLVTNTLGTGIGVLLYRTTFARRAMNWVITTAKHFLATGHKVANRSKTVRRA